MTLEERRELRVLRRTLRMTRYALLFVCCALLGFWIVLGLTFLSRPLHE